MCVNDIDTLHVCTAYIVLYIISFFSRSLMKRYIRIYTKCELSVLHTNSMVLTNRNCSFVCVCVRARINIFLSCCNSQQTFDSISLCQNILCVCVCYFDAFFVQQNNWFAEKFYLLLITCIFWNHHHVNASASLFLMLFFFSLTFCQPLFVLLTYHLFNLSVLYEQVKESEEKTKFARSFRFHTFILSCFWCFFTRSSMNRLNKFASSD